MNDARRDPRFAANPLVTGAPFIRFYAGSPLITNTGQRLGTLCAIDHEPRNISVDKQYILEELAQTVVDQLGMRLARQRRLANEDTSLDEKREEETAEVVREFLRNIDSRA